MAPWTHKYAVTFEKTFSKINLLSTVGLFLNYAGSSAALLQNYKHILYATQDYNLLASDIKDDMFLGKYNKPFIHVTHFSFPNRRH